MLKNTVSGSRNEDQETAEWISEDDAELVRMPARSISTVKIETYLEAETNLLHLDLKTAIPMRSEPSRVDTNQGPCTVRTKMLSQDQKLRLRDSGRQRSPQEQAVYLEKKEDGRVGEQIKRKEIRQTHQALTLLDQMMIAVLQRMLRRTVSA